MNPPRRAWFQIRLSTAIVLMFVAGGLIGANVVERSVHYPDLGRYGDFLKRGWPITYWERNIFREWEQDLWHRLLVDLAIGLLILGAAAFVSECLFRRREAPQGMSEKPRRWFQIHLSTAVVLTISAGGLLGLNLHHFRQRLNPEDEPFFRRFIVGEEYRSFFNGEQGWPLTFWRFLEDDLGEVRPYAHDEFQYPTLAADVVIGLCMLGAMASYCEWRINRRKARKP